jgi:hypothetical protein
MGTISGAVSTLVGNVQTLLPVFLAVANGATPLEAINSAMSSGASAAQVMAAAASPIGGIMMGIAQSISAMGGLGAVFTAIAGAVGGVLVAIVGLAVFADIAAAISGGAALIVGAILFILSPIGMVLAAAALLGAAYATNFGGMRDSINQVAGLLGSTLLIAAQGAGHLIDAVAHPAKIGGVGRAQQSRRRQDHPNGREDEQDGPDDESRATADGRRNIGKDRQPHDGDQDAAHGPGNGREYRPQPAHGADALGNPHHDATDGGCRRRHNLSG